MGLVRIAWIGALALVVGCGAAEPRSETLTVFAASSLTEVVDDLAASYEAENRGTEVATSFAGSQVLRLQIEEGAPADVFLSADEGHMAALEAAGLVEGARVFARSELVVIVPREGSPIRRFEDLPRARRLVIGDPHVPVGRYTRALFDRLEPGLARRVRANVVSEEPNVRLVRAKVEMGEADAAIVYRTDASDAVRTVSIPESLNVAVAYYVAVVAASPHRASAHRWVDHLLGPAGARRLAARGFTPADATRSRRQPGPVE